MQSGQLIETIIDTLGADYPPNSRDIRTRHGALLEDWLIQFHLFNRLGKISVSADGLDCTFARLASDKDLEVVLDVLDRITRALSIQNPSLGLASESVSGNVVYEVVGGGAVRAKYLSGISFPGRASIHEDVSVKSRLHHPSQPIRGLFEVAPRFGEESQLFFYFDVDTTKLVGLKLRQRGEIANELVLQALASFDLQQVEEASK